MSDPQRPHGLQPSRPLHPWDFPGKSTGVGCHRLLRSLVQSWVEIMSLSHKPLDSYFKQKWRPSAGSETWCFSFTISPPKEYSGFISFRTDWFHLSLTCIQVFQEAGKVVCFSHLLKNFPQFVVIHTVKGFRVVHESETDVFLEFSGFFYDPVDGKWRKRIEPN